MLKARKFANAMMVVVLVAAMTLLPLVDALAAPKPAYQVLAPITQDNLTIFPVVAPTTEEAGKFLTLDEGLSSGLVIVTEAGQPKMMETNRMRPQIETDERVARPTRGDGAEVNRLVLINKSDRPLLLLAGEIVTGGKQDRVVGKDRIVPPHSAPVDLSVFCVEPGRWVHTSSSFGGMKAQMAQPSVRRGAMAEQSQAKVWDEVRSSQRAMVGGVAGAPPASATTSYATVMKDDRVRHEVDKVAAPLERSYEQMFKQLRERKAVGVVVAVNGRVIWADVFSSTSLIEKYWPKLVRSYAAEAVVARVGVKPVAPSKDEAQRFLMETAGGREVVQTEPGVYRSSEVQGEGYMVFALTSLVPGTNYVVHLAKMVTGPVVKSVPVRPTAMPEPALVRPHVQW